MATAYFQSGQRLADPVAELLHAMRSAGIDPADPSQIVADGKLRRFRVEGDRAGSANGWAVLHHDHGAAGSWKGGASCTWSAKSAGPMSRAERDAFGADMRKARADAQRQLEGKQHNAAQRAADLWAKTRQADPSHPYLLKKRIQPGVARQSGELLVLRIIDIEGELHGLQYIGPDGTKRMLSGTAKRGHFVVVAGTLPADLIVIGEGFATCMTVADEFPDAAVLAAIDAGNLLQVAHAVRTRHPSTQIVIAADDDRMTPGNPGLTKAREAAAAVGAKVARPAWPPGIPLDASDFNDAACFLLEKCHG